VWTRCRAWLQYEGYSHEVASDSAVSFRADPAGRFAEWRFMVPCGMGREVPFSFVLELAPGENAARLRVERGDSGPGGFGERVRIVFRPDLECRSFHGVTKAYCGERAIAEGIANDVHLDVFGGEFANRFFELEALPVRNVEGRTDFDVVFVNERAFFRKNDRADVEVRFANRGHVGVFVRLGQAVDEERALDAFFDVGLEAFFNQFARSFTGAETRNRGVFLEFGVFDFETFFNIFARNFDFDVTFARAFFFNVDFERQFFNVFESVEIFHFCRPY
jgi:hypothetical protein